MDWSAAHFGSIPGMGHFDALGYCLEAYQGRVTHSERYHAAPSGGLCTEVLAELLRRGDVDAVVVPQSLDVYPWFESRIVSSVSEVYASSGSVYHATPMNETIREVLYGGERRYAVVGLPCMVQGIRLLQCRFPTAKRRIRFLLGLACSGLQTRCFADYVTALLGGKTGRLIYRQTSEKASDSLHARMVLETRARKKSIPSMGLSMHYRAYEASVVPGCRFCDDFFSETADAVFMEAFLPEIMKQHPGGTSLTVVRNAELSELLTSGIASGHWMLEPISPCQVERSQMEQVCRRRSRVPARLRWMKNQGYAIPPKRVGLCEKFIVSDFDETRQDKQAHRELSYYEKMRRHVRRYRPFLKSKHPVVAWLFALRLWWLSVSSAFRHGMLGNFMKGSIPETLKTTQSSHQQKNKEKIDDRGNSQ